MRKMTSFFSFVSLKGGFELGERHHLEFRESDREVFHNFIDQTIHRSI